MNNVPKLIVFSAPSGAGKTTLVRHLLKQEELNLAFSISAASREAREGEIDGVHYYFLGIKEFKQRIRDEKFLEFEEVYKDQFYGTLKTEVERLWAQGKNVIFDIDVVGGLRLKKKFPDRTIAIFVKPPSINELQIRLKKRKTESQEKIAMRVAKASTEMATAPQFDVIIENDDLDQAKNKAYRVVQDYINAPVASHEEE
ncbi:guanylate kinase [Nonlabens ponticola]|uniref:Guanylate kinase n=1 Tax=Nonlabens ponticola TaxID=2496866 RepID=A0A3S9MW40_9FLAO|nr:guanylate kinase [Nonlabens ponticola]AZQ43349.1 guanylate kinase [Nonlabens ponticola]